MMVELHNLPAAMFQMPMPVLAALPAIVVTLIKMAIVTAISTAVSVGISYLLTKRPKGAKAAGASAFELPTAQENRPPSVVWGTRTVTGPNYLSPILEFAAKKKKHGHGKSRTTVAHYYHVTLHIGVAQAHLDGVLQIGVADTCLWPTVKDPTVYAADGQTSATIAAHECWGGWEREGGVAGTLSIQYGGDAQTTDAYLAALLADQPAYRGCTGVVLQKMYIGTQAIIKPWWFVCRRRLLMSDGTAMWQLANASVGTYDLNAVCVLYELLTSSVIGLGHAATRIGTSFAAAAATCHTEGYGVSAIWDWSPDTANTMIEGIESVIDGKLYWDPATGKFELGLIRADYDPDLLDTFDESDFWVESMAGSSPGLVPSTTRVLWYDRDTDQARPATARDPALLYRQGGAPIVREIDLAAWVCDGDLAQQIADREQQQISCMPRTLVIHALRTMSHLHETSVIKITYAALNLSAVIFRVALIDRGSITDEECVLTLVEDVFGTVYATQAVPPGAAGSSASETSTDEDIDDGTMEAAATAASTETGPY